MPPADPVDLVSLTKIKIKKKKNLKEFEVLETITENIRCLKTRGHTVKVRILGLDTGRQLISDGVLTRTIDELVRRAAENHEGANRFGVTVRSEANEHAVCFTSFTSRRDQLGWAVTNDIERQELNLFSFYFFC
jgi:hypothetical protein